MQGPSLPVLGSVPIVPHTFSILFRLSGPRTWVFPSFSFILGYAVGGGGELAQIGIGIAVASLVTAATNIINAYADRKEDATNQPQRLFWLGQIGSRQITASLLLLYSISTALALYLGPFFTLVLGLGIFNSIFYSLPPLRFKAKPIASLLSFSGALGLPFLGGLSVRGSLDLLNPMLWLLTWFMFTYGTVKNLPDYFGDMKAGIRTSATIFKNVKKAVLFSGTLLSTPYIVLVTLVALGFLGPIYIADLALVPSEECSRQQRAILRPPQRPSRHPYHNRAQLRALGTAWRGKDHHLPEPAQRSRRSRLEMSLCHNKQSSFADQRTDPSYGTSAGKG